MIVPPDIQFDAERIVNSNLRSGTADNDLNATKSMGMLPDGVKVITRLTDADAWFIRTDCPDSLKHIVRVKVKRGMQGDFETGNMRYKARERYSFGWSDWRGAFASAGAS